jgi:hypothetical protein
MREIALTQVDYQPSPDGYEIIASDPSDSHGLYAPDPDIIYEDLQKRLEEGNDTYEIIHGPSGRNYEIAIFNPAKLAVARILRPSTSFSSLYKNPGNALEIALSAAANPGAAHIYIASFGNQPTGHMTSTDRKYVSQTGRYTRGNGTLAHPYRPIASVQDMAEALQSHDPRLAPTDLSTDAEAGRLALGLMAAFEHNSIKGAYLNGLDGISPSAHYEAARLSEDLRSRIHRRGIGEGKPGELTPVNIKDVKKRMPRIYHGLGSVAHIAPLPVFLYPKDVRDKLELTKGFRGHKDLLSLTEHAVANDMLAALTRQNTMITLQFNKESAEHDIGDCIKFGGMIMNCISEEMRTEERGVRLLIGEGGLDKHTDAPHDRTRVERYVLSHIQHMLGRILTDSDILQLKPVKKVA